MNREIKFRAWDVQKNEMHYFGVFSFEQFMFVGIRPDEVRQRVYPFDGIESGEMVTKDPLNAWSLMQFTGLLDKNGKEIYEGDVIQMDNQKYEVFWEEDNGRWGRRIKSGYQFSSGMSNPQMYEVIGNIYEHNHLLNP